jgi:crotonobetainyl-CoA:carnitine CoA-transferase CaiB-like acyl-CoA transferase
MAYVMNGSLGERIGNRDAIMAPHGCYRCAGDDGWVAIAVAGQKEWKTFCEVLGNPEWTRKEIFSDELSRWKNQDELDKHVEAWTLQHHTYEITAKLQNAGVMAIPSLSTKQFVEDEHIKEKRFMFQTDHPVLGRILLTGLLLRAAIRLKETIPIPRCWVSITTTSSASYWAFQRRDKKLLGREGFLLNRIPMNHQPSFML